MTVDELKALLAASPNKIVNITETVEIWPLDHLDLDGHDVRSTAIPMFRINGYHWSIRNGKIRAEAGVAIDLVSSSLGRVIGVWLQTGVPDKEIVRCVGSNQCYDTLFENCQLEHGPGMTVPIVNISVSGPFYNSNSWNNIRFQTNGNSSPPTVPCVVMECLVLGAWLNGNSFTNINGEIPNAGLIHCNSCYGTILQNIAIYDAHIGGDITEDLVRFGKTPNGLDCRNTIVRSYIRLGGNLVEGKYDVHIANHYADGMLLEQISSIGASLRVKCPIGATRIEVQDFNNSWRNI